MSGVTAGARGRGRGEGRRSCKPHSIPSPHPLGFFPLTSVLRTGLSIALGWFWTHPSPPHTGVFFPPGHLAPPPPHTHTTVCRARGWGGRLSYHLSCWTAEGKPQIPGHESICNPPSPPPATEFSNTVNETPRTHLALLVNAQSCMGDTVIFQEHQSSVFLSRVCPFANTSASSPNAFVCSTSIY